MFGRESTGVDDGNIASWFAWLLEIGGSRIEALFSRESGPSMFGRESAGVDDGNITSWFAWLSEIRGFGTETLFCGESEVSLKGEVEFTTYGLPWFHLAAPKG